MRKLSKAIILSFIMATVLAGVRNSAAEEIDRLLAAVNGKAVTETDLDYSRRMNSLLGFGKDKSDWNRQQELDRLIDLELIRQELQSFPMTREDEGSITKGIEDLKKGYDRSPGGLAAVSAQYGLSEEDIKRYLRLQSSIMRFVGFRFTPFVSVPQEEKEKYYREILVPQLERAKAVIPPLSEVEEKIDAVLRQQKASSALEQWIAELRQHARLEYFTEKEYPELSK
jgi:hypothetical protein